MNSGLNQEVHVLGRTFHFQTELTRKGDLFVRTEVFVGGKVVATREKRINPDPHRALDEETLLAAMKTQHNAVIASTIERVKTYRKQKDAQQAADTAPPEALAFDPPKAKQASPPSEDARAAAASAVRIRRIFGRFRLRLGLGESLSQAEIVERLETAGRGFTWILSAPTFEEIRVVEQMRCHLVHDLVNEWLAGDRDSAGASRIWSEIVTFNQYVAEINNRAELIAFDRQLLMWAAYQVQNGGISDEIRDQLQWVSGRDLELDRLLDRPTDVTSEAWFASLCQALAQMPSDGGS